jgi:hypothetical protein
LKIARGGPIFAIRSRKLGRGRESSVEKPPKTDKPDNRKARLAEQLRANLQKRKAQARSRRAGEADQRAEGLPGGKAPRG